jgi:hypothetical protein
MSLVPGNSQSLRIPAFSANGAIAPGVSINHDADTTSDIPETDDSGTVLRIQHGDGSVTVSLDGRSLGDGPDEPNLGWFANLIDKIDEQELYRIADDLIRGVEDDLRSRTDWVEDRAQGIKLLGFRIEIPGISSAADGAPVEGMSKVRHPLLQEAVLRFQANARSEMLPTDGPAKIRDDANGSNLQRDQVADAFERDFNHFLTVTATEYVPDTDKMLLLLGFGGTAFKKVYNCPLRNRPVSESVDADDLIVNNAATDLANAKRATHRTMMRPSTVRRLQILGVYKDVDLSTPHTPNLDATQQEKKAQQGVTPDAVHPYDRDREIYECYCELDIKGFEHKHKGKPSGLEIPYRVTIDVSSKHVLSIVRNYDEDTKKLPEARENFVKYTFVPGFGFYDLGLLHILGNTTNAITAAWRELLDAGMYNNFPGCLMADTGARQNTNIFRIPPGGAALVKTGGLPLKDAFMPLPYNPPSPALMQLVDSMATTGARVGGISEQPVGEGKANAPVGTTLALIEQATIMLNSVHKRMHAAQARELQLIARCFRENPKAFWQRNKKPARQWDEKTFRQALDDVDLVPQADPNTSSHIQRIMKITALKQLQSASPQMYDPIAIDTAALQALGFNNPQQFFAPPEAQASPPPDLLKEQAESAAKTKMADAAMLKAQASAEKAKADVQSLQSEAGKAAGGEVETDTDRLKAKSEMTVAQARAQAELINAHTRAHEADTKRGETALTDAREEDDSKRQEKLGVLDLAKEVLIHHSKQQHESEHKEADREHERALKAAELQAAAAKASAPEKKGKKDE